MTPSVRINIDNNLLDRIDEARGNITRGEYISHICDRTVMSNFPRQELSTAQAEYVARFEAHLRTPAGIDTALDIATQLAVTLERRKAA